jgi:hypothetical protein
MEIEMIDKLKIVRQQFNTVMDIFQAEDQFIYALMEPAISAIHSILLTGDLSEERLSKVKEILHILDGITSNMNDHGLDENIDTLKLWSYLYSVYDYLLQLVYENEEE